MIDKTIIKEPQELINAAYKVCLLIEKIKECSTEQTTAVSAASDLLSDLQRYFELPYVYPEAEDRP